MERMGPRRAGDENGDGTTAGRTGAVRAAAATVAVVAALAGCSVTVQPKNAAATRPLTSSPTPSASSGTAPSTSASAASPSSSPSPTPAPSDVDHSACTSVREALSTLRDKLETDKNSASRTAQDYRNAGYSLRTQGTKTKNSELKSTLKTVASDYLTVGSEAANHESTEADLTKVADASKPLSTLCGGGSSSTGSSSTSTSTGSSTTTSSSSG